MSRRPLALLVTTAVGALLPLAGVPTATTPALGAAPAEPAATLRAPSRIEVTTRRDVARVSLRTRFAAGTAPVEFRATRASYGSPIRVEVSSAAGTATLPEGSMTRFDRLQGLLRLKITDLRTGRSTFRNRPVCLNSYESQRIRPDAPPRTPYPDHCFTNPYALGMVHGVQAGWASRIENDGVRLSRGRYDVRLSLGRAYRQALGLSVAEASRTVRVVVKRGEGAGHHARTPRPRTTAARPAASEPTGVQLREPTGPRPNLRSVPAWNISVRGEILRFNATVWNAGDSPLVVDGFRDDDDSTTMRAYQYFFDTDGNQVGYQDVGSFVYHDHKSHQHWHFRDFARYRLLNADRSEAVRSRKNAFCLANTDSVDLTVPGAQWRPENTDLGTHCGDDDSMAMRQVLASGWGDTYAQFRAGQAFSLSGLPNGWYHIAVEANPRGRLVESSTADNVRLRRVWIGGKPGNRRVGVRKIGLVDESALGQYW